MKTKAIVDIDCRGTAPSQSLTTLTAFPFVVPAAGTLFGVHWVDDVPVRVRVRVRIRVRIRITVRVTVRVTVRIRVRVR